MKDICNRVHPVGLSVARVDRHSHLSNCSPACAFVVVCPLSEEAPKPGGLKHSDMNKQAVPLSALKPFCKTEAIKVVGWVGFSITINQSFAAAEVVDKNGDAMRVIGYKDGKDVVASLKAGELA